MVDSNFQDVPTVKLSKKYHPDKNNNCDYSEFIKISESYQRLMKLYKETGLGKVKGQIFEVNSFREGLNSLLNEAKLKTIKRGDAVLTIDSKSFRNMFIQFMLDKGVHSNAIAKNCGTRTAMIDNHYTANSAIESMLDVWLTTGRTNLKSVS